MLQKEAELVGKRRPLGYDEQHTFARERFAVQTSILVRIKLSRWKNPKYQR
jgi:hypothetical protein